MTENKPTHEDELKACPYPSTGDYTQTTTLPRPKHMYPTDHADWINIDKCMVNEILSLWRGGIWTLECCCGHGRAGGYVAVHGEHREAIEALGYEPSAEAPHVYKKKSQCQATPDPQPDMGDVSIREAEDSGKTALKPSPTKPDDVGNAVDIIRSLFPHLTYSDKAKMETLITAAQSAEQAREDLRLQQSALNEYHEKYNALRLSLSKAEEHGRWRGIEDGCPEDGTVVLLAWKNSMKKFVVNNGHIPDWCFEARSYCIIGSGGARSYHGQATHWQPLPTAPQPAATPEGEEK